MIWRTMVPAVASVSAPSAPKPVVMNTSRSSVGDQQHDAVVDVRPGRRPTSRRISVA